jgi:hypothetical protein
MRGPWIIALMAALLTTPAIVSTVSQPASAQVMPIGEPESSELCEITLGGRCPRGYRSCLRSQPREVCEQWLEGCYACADSMHECRKQVGQTEGVTCVECRETFDRCMEELSVDPSR